ncbi:Glutathione S-transferase [Trichinella zimbabwensis]|uniref:Glutathione S-transferase n=1 Tax=Trichinella zimbabwensis TaxID=268475 RepID=A0A0V1HRR8_9BILA|nr:Glutathione S-transferase [Trichinella zimbabwensis]
MIQSGQQKLTRGLKHCEGMPVFRRFTIKCFRSSPFVEQIRLLFRDQQVSYYENIIDSGNVNGLEATEINHNLPCLYDGEQQIDKLGASMRHLGRVFDLYGSAEQMTYVDIVYEALRALQMEYEEFKQSGQWFLINRLPEHMPFLDEQLYGKMYFLNERISFVDYTMMEMLRLLLNVDPNCLDAYPSVLQFYENMRNRPNIAAYLQ